MSLKGVMAVFHTRKFCRSWTGLICLKSKHSLQPKENIYINTLMKKIIPPYWKQHHNIVWVRLAGYQSSSVHCSNYLTRLSARGEEESESRPSIKWSYRPCPRHTAADPGRVTFVTRDTWQMLVTMICSLLVLAWTAAISATWYLVRRYHRSKPPGRQTVRTSNINSSWNQIHKKVRNHGEGSY